MRVQERSSVNPRVPELDALYVYKTRHKAPFTQRLQESAGYVYSDSQAVQKSEENEIYIYHQTFEVDGVSNGITMVTKEKRKTKVKQFFEDAIDEVSKDTKMTNSFKLAKLSPSQIGIYYSY